MEKPTIGLSQRFQPSAATATVLSGTASAGGVKGKTLFSATTLDWKIKMVVMLLVAALLYFLVVRYLKKKGKTCAKSESDEAKSEDKKGEKS